MRSVEDIAEESVDGWIDPMGRPSAVRFAAEAARIAQGELAKKVAEMLAEERLFELDALLASLTKEGK